MAIFVNYFRDIAQGLRVDRLSYLYKVIMPTTSLRTGNKVEPDFCILGNDVFFQSSKGQTKSKWFFLPKKRTNEFYFTTYYDTSGRLVFVRFLDEIEDTKKTFRN